MTGQIGGGERKKAREKRNNRIWLTIGILVIAGSMAIFLKVTGGALKAEKTMQPKGKETKEKTKDGRFTKTYEQNGERYVFAIFRDDSTGAEYVFFEDLGHDIGGISRLDKWEPAPLDTETTKEGWFRAGMTYFLKTPALFTIKPASGWKEYSVAFPVFSWIDSDDTRHEYRGYELRLENKICTDSSYEDPMP